MKTILIMAGGTGGHIFPALAVAGEMKESGFDVVWLGTRGGMESKLVPDHGYEIEYVKMSGVRKSGLSRWALLPVTLLFACIQALSVLRKRKPDVVLGMGGFASFPGAVAAFLLGCPLVIHEQNAIAGLSNRVISKFAKRTLVAFPDAIPGGTFVGNPVRKEIAALSMGSREGRLKLLVMGGSRGARAINDAMPKAMALIGEKFRPDVLHQSGEADCERVKAAYADSGCDAEVVPFISDVAKAYAECDLVLGRSGALTVAEIAAAGLPSILVPYPHAVDDHQSANARYLSDAGAAWLVPQNELEPEKIAAMITKLDRERLQEMGRKARRLAVIDATEKVGRICRELAA